jgi:hypothetical protein
VTPGPENDWWAPHVAIAAFAVLVAAILGAVPGWTAPLHAWIMLAALAIGALAVHAAARAVATACRRRWSDALPGLWLALGLGVAGLALLLLGHWSRPTNDDVFDDQPVVRHGPSR